MERYFHFFTFVSCLMYIARNQEILNHQNCIVHVNDQLLVLQGISVSNCTRECKLRPGCRSVYYNTNYKICKINDVGTDTGLLQDLKKLYTRHVDPLWKEELLCSPPCILGQRCNQHPGNCEIHECKPPQAVANADIYGNRRIVGSKIQYRCKTDTSKAYTSVCLNNGSWSSVNACPESIDCGAPVKEGYVFETPTSTAYEGTVSASCAKGFFCGIGKMKSTCLVNGSWEEPAKCLNPDDYMIGCYQDNDTRALSHRMNPEPPITPTVCIKYCIDKEYPYAAVQNGHACFCGSTDDNYNQYGEASNCNYACKGDGIQQCGGPWANMVYNTSSCVT